LLFFWFYSVFYCFSIPLLLYSITSLSLCILHPTFLPYYIRYSSSFNKSIFKKAKMSSFKQLYLGATLLLSLTHQAACNPTEEHDLSVRFDDAQDLDARDIENIRALVERDLEIRRGGGGAGGRGGKGSSATVTDGFPGYTPGGGGGKGRRSLETRKGGAFSRRRRLNQ
jgi:uncharacterized membrane protein YgcG